MRRRGRRGGGGAGAGEMQCVCAAAGTVLPGQRAAQNPVSNWRVLSCSAVRNTRASITNACPCDCACVRDCVCMTACALQCASGRKGGSCLGAQRGDAGRAATHRASLTLPIKVFRTGAAQQMKPRGETAAGLVCDKDEQDRQGLTTAPQSARLCAGGCLYCNKQWASRALGWQEPRRDAVNAG